LDWDDFRGLFFLLELLEELLLLLLPWLELPELVGGDFH
jgi:hypothetical protein